MKPSPQQIALINSIAMEIGWWKEGLVTHAMVEEYVKHEVNGLVPEHQNQLTNALNTILRIIKQVE